MNICFSLTTAALALMQATKTAQQAEAQVMSGGGWLFMSAAWVCILALVLFTFGKILRGGRK